MTIHELAQNTAGRLYLYLADEETCERFLKDAEEEGFRFRDGARPTARPRDCIYAVNRDRTLNYVGFAGHAAFMCAEKIGEEALVKIDYRQFRERR